MRLVFSDVPQLILRQAARPHLADAQAARDGLRRVFVVAREQNRLYTQTGQGGNCRRAFPAQGIGQRKEACKRTVYRHIGDRAALLNVCLGRRHSADLHAVLAQQLGIAREHFPTLYLRAHAPAGYYGKVVRDRQLGAAFPAAVHDGFAQRMLGELFRGGGQAVDFILIPLGRNAVRRNNLRRAAGQRAGLVEGDDLAHPASRSSASPSRTRKPCFVALPMAAMMAVGVASTSAQGQNTTSIVTARMICAGQQPGQRCGGQGDHHDPGCPAVSQADDLRLARVRRLHQANHPLNGAVLPDALVASISKAPNWLTVPLDTSSPDAFVHGQRFAGHHRLIDGGLRQRGSRRPPERVSPGSTRSTVSDLHLLGGDDRLPCRRAVRAPSAASDAPAFRYPPAPCATVSSSSKRAQLHDERHFAGGKGPLRWHTEAIRARETSTSALMSNAVTSPMSASSMIGRPHSTIAIHAISNGNANHERFQCILTNPEKRKIVDILPDRTASAIQSYLKSFPNRSEVEYFVMDMNRAYLEIGKTFLPQAKIVIDRFHFVRCGVWAFENVRRRVQKKLSAAQRKYFKRSRKLLLARASRSFRPRNARPWRSCWRTRRTLRAPGC